MTTPNGRTPLTPPGAKRPDFTDRLVIAAAHCKGLIDQLRAGWLQRPLLTPTETERLKHALRGAVEHLTAAQVDLNRASAIAGPQMPAPVERSRNHGNI